MTLRKKIKEAKKNFQKKKVKTKNNDNSDDKSIDDSWKHDRTKMLTELVGARNLDFNSISLLSWNRIY